MLIQVKNLSIKIESDSLKFKMISPSFFTLDCHFTFGFSHFQFTILEAL